MLIFFKELTLKYFHEVKIWIDKASVKLWLDKSKCILEMHTKVCGGDRTWVWNWL